MNPSKRTVQTPSNVNRSRSFQQSKGNSLDGKPSYTRSDNRSSLSLSSDTKRPTHNDKMSRFKHHAEQQFSQYSRKPNETEYEQCFIQPVNNTTTHKSDTMSNSYQSVHVEHPQPPLHSSILQNDNSMTPHINKSFRSRSQAFSVDKYVSSTVSNNSSSRSLQSSRTPMFSKERKTLVKSMNYTPDDLSDDSVQDRRVRKNKKKRFSIPFFSKKKHHKRISDSLTSDKEDSNLSSSKSIKNESSHHASSSLHISKPTAPPTSHPPTEFDDISLPDRDIHALRRDVDSQRLEIRRLETFLKELENAYNQAKSVHENEMRHFSQLQEYRQRKLYELKENLLKRKKEEKKEMMIRLGYDLGGTIQDKMKDVQEKIDKCNNLKKQIVERNITPYQDFYSRILAYCVTGITVVGSVLIYLFLFIQTCLGFSSSSLIKN